MRTAFRSPALTALAAVLLSGCMVGPDYVRPELPLPARFAASADGQPQVAVARGWWKLFNDDTLNALVASLGEDGALESVAGPLRRSHAGFRATPAQYAAVGEALMWTLGASVGKAFTAPMRAAWSEAYAGLAAAMQGDRGGALTG